MRLPLLEAGRTYHGTIRTQLANRLSAEPAIADGVFRGRLAED
jgi:hypothetical protein